MRRQRREKPRGRNGPDASSSVCRALYDKARKHFQENRLPEALELFRQVLSLDPSHADSLHYLGIIALTIGHAEDAINLSRQAIALAPGHAGAHGNLADALAVTGRLAEAEKHYEHVLALKPDAATYTKLATVYAVGNDMTRALHAAVRGLKINETPKLKSLFVGCLQQATSVPSGDDFRAFLMRALSEPWHRPGNLAKVSVALIKQDSCIAEPMRRAMERWPERATLGDLYGQDGLTVVSRDRLLRVLLESTQLADIALERLLTLTRCAFLEAVTTNREAVSTDRDMIAFGCALAHQCFTNEYVFDCSPEEMEQIRILAHQLATTERADPFAVAVFAAYQPLHTLTSCDALQDLPGPVQSLITRQVHEPMAERALRDSIPRLTPVDDEISALVRQQYEENPYPRWIKTAADVVPETIDRQMQSRHPHAPYRPLGKADSADILIAGCGTGRQALEMARSVINARVMAVDLSLSSLSYAKYRTEALGLTNISYGQADILELASLDCSFDMIVCSGVLHHMSDPLQGWRVLLSLLRPNGVMEIALYSETARTEIVAAREFIAQRGYGSSAGDIRRARQDIFSLEDSSPLKRVVNGADFFGTSTCRDLLFHVQEQRFNLPQIQTFLAEHDLEFLGFLLGPQHRQEYIAAYPDDRACTNLENWHRFEQRHPTLFRGMYQFHVQKKP